MKKIAQIIINSDVKTTDKIYSYYVDDSLNLKEGMRVEVPFGNGNRKAVGYFIGFTDEISSEYNLKDITRVIDKTPVLSHNAINLAKYIRKTYICSMAEALHLLLPPVVNLKFEKHISLTGKDFTDSSLSPAARNILDILAAAGKPAEIKKLLAAAGVKSPSPLKKLAADGYIEIKEVPIGKAKEKIQKFATIADENFDISLLKSSPKARAAFEIILQHKSLPISDVIKIADCSPSSVKLLKNKGAIIIEDKQVLRRPGLIDDVTRKTDFVPTDEQQNALDYIYSVLDEHKKHDILLHGVTGSGKTEVFIKAASHCIKNGRNVIILVPEISLTPQIQRRFTEYFGDSVAVLHSALSAGERFDEWQRIKKGDVQIVVGARSAIFAPFENIGLIIVDEEHDSSYLSESSPRYNAIDVALYRGKQEDAVVMLSSATPSVTSYHRALSGRYKLLEMKNRFNNSPLPHVETVDMRYELTNGNKSVLSRRLKEEIAKNLQRGEQTILFLNRRGYSTFVSCRSCGYVCKCPHCSITMTYHASDDSLTCHYCGHKTKSPDVCPECESLYIKYFGTGTQRVEEDILKEFPDASILRMDADTTGKKLSHQKLLKKFADEKVDILLGTQMVTKGLDFPLVTLVGVISADAMLNMDDYRASERTFSQLTQVCGRSGRGNVPGRAIVQTYCPENPIFSITAMQDYKKFYEGEIKLRKLMDNPPFSAIINIVISSENEINAASYAKSANKFLETEFEDCPGLVISKFGPAPAPISKIKNKYRYRILVKVNKDAKILDILQKLYYGHIANKVSEVLEISINPNSIL